MKLDFGVTLLFIKSVLAVYVLSVGEVEMSTKTFGTTAICGRNIKYAAPFCFTYLLIVSNSFLKISV